MLSAVKAFAERTVFGAFYSQIRAGAWLAGLSRRLVHVVAIEVAKATGTTRWRDWQIDFGPVKGKAGETKVIPVTPGVRFRGEKTMATDTASTAGMGTLIQTVLIGQKTQRPFGSGSTLTLFFSHQALGNGIKWDVCEPWETIHLTVHFIVDCDFHCTVFGKKQEE